MDETTGDFGEGDGYNQDSNSMNENSDTTFEDQLNQDIADNQANSVFEGNASDSTNTDSGSSINWAGIANTALKDVGNIFGGGGKTGVGSWIDSLLGPTLKDAAGGVKVAVPGVPTSIWVAVNVCVFVN